MMPIDEVFGVPDDTAETELKRIEEIRQKEILLGGLERDFFEILADRSYVRTNQADLIAGGLLPALLDLAARVEEKKQQRKLTDYVKVQIRARKAAELLPRVPYARLGEDMVYEFCVTRKLLWEAIADGAMHNVLAVEVTEKLFDGYKLSPNEEKVLLSVLRERFGTDTGTHTVLRNLLVAVKPHCDRPALRTILHGIVKSAGNAQLLQIAELLALKPSV